MDTQMSDETDEPPPPTKDLAFPDVEAPVPNSSEAFLINDIPRVTSSNTIVSVALDYPEVFTEKNIDRTRTNTPVDDSTAASVIDNAATVKDLPQTHFYDEDDDINAKKKRHKWERVQSCTGAQLSFFSSKAALCTRWLTSGRRGQALFVVLVCVTVAACVGVPAIMEVASETANSAGRAMNHIIEKDQAMVAEMFASPIYSG